MSTTPSASPQPPATGPTAAPAAKGGGAKVFLWILGIFFGLVFLVVLSIGAVAYYAVHKVKQFADNPVLTAAKFMVAANPDLETVSSDDNTIVVHDRKTGKNETMKIDPEKKTMVVTDDQGKTVTFKLDPQRNTLVMTDENGKTATVSANTNGLVLTDPQGKTATISADQQSGTVQMTGADGSTVKIGTNADKAPSWVPVYPGATPQSTFSASSAKEQGGTYSFVTADGPDKVLDYYEGALKSGGMKTSNAINKINGQTSGWVTGSSDGDKRSVMVTVGVQNDGTHVAVVFSNKQ
jgi:hypothetical protein